MLPERSAFSGSATPPALTPPPSGLIAGLGLALLYAVSHGLMLIDQGVFHDDWVLYRVPEAVIRTNIDTSGSRVFTYLHVWLSSPSFAVALGNWFTFLTYLASGLLVWDVLRRTRGLGAAEAWVLAALAIVLPLNLARNLMINNQYSACQLFFWLAFWVFQTNELRPRRVVGLTVLAAVLFFGAFLTNSYLVFFILAPLWALWHRQPRTLAALRTEALRLTPWLLLPVAYWLVRTRYFQPSGIHANLHYNELTADHLLRVPFEIGRTIYFSLLKPLAVMPRALASWVVAPLALGLGGIVLAVWRGQWLPAVSGLVNRRRAALGVGVGAALFALGAFPYVAVGQLPTQVEWSSRHQLLLPFGEAALLLYGLELLTSFLSEPLARRLRQAGLVVLLLLCVGQNIKFYLQYERDWLKQMSMKRQFAALPAVQANTTFLVEDSTRNINIFERSYRFYEYGGLLRQAFGDERRFAITEGEMIQMRDDLPNGLHDLAGHSEHLLSQYQLTPPQVRLVILPGAPVTDAQVLARTLHDDPVRDDPAAPLVRVRAEPLAPGTAPAIEKTK